MQCEDCKSIKECSSWIPVTLRETVYQLKGMRQCQPESEKHLLEEMGALLVLLIPASNCQLHLKSYEGV